jgi:hypothetical protein
LPTELSLAHPQLNKCCSQSYGDGKRGRGAWWIVINLNFKNEIKLIFHCEWWWREMDEKHMWLIIFIYFSYTLGANAFWGCFIKLIIAEINVIVEICIK